MKNSETPMPTSSKIIFDESEEDDSSSDEEAKIERELADIPFGEVQKARSDGTLSFQQNSNPQKTLAIANKKRPMEMSSKKPVGRFREVIQAPTKIARDPRFESLCGKFDSEGFKIRYNFLYEEQLPAGKEELQKHLKKSKDPKVIVELKSRISEIEKQLKTVNKECRITDFDCTQEERKSSRGSNHSIVRNLKL